MQMNLFFSSKKIAKDTQKIHIATKVSSSCSEFHVARAHKNFDGKLTSFFFVVVVDFNHIICFLAATLDNTEYGLAVLLRLPLSSRSHDDALLGHFSI